MGIITEAARDIGNVPTGDTEEMADAFAGGAVRSTPYTRSA